jgi:hypothetical protein
MHTRSLGATGTAIPNPLTLSHLQRKHAKEHNYKGTYDNERPLRIPRWGVSFRRGLAGLLPHRKTVSSADHLGDGSYRTFGPDQFPVRPTILDAAVAV